MSNKTVQTPSKGLRGLLSHYNSDSEAEESLETDKLDSKVDNFLQEINSIAPAETATETPPLNTKWQECYDESSGYPYYWNLETNQVTWEMPEDYKNYLNSTVVKTTSTVSTTPVECKKQLVDDKKRVNIDKNDNSNSIEDENEIITKVEENKTDDDVKNKKKTAQKKKPMRTRKSSSDSDDGKIELITSYSEETSDSETETPIEKPKEVEIREKSPLQVLGPHVEDIPKDPPPLPKEETKKEIIECYKEDIDETVILARIRTQAKVLQELDGEIPESVDRLLNNLEKNNGTAPSLSLVAGYGDDSENEEETDNQHKLIFPIPDKKENIITITTSESTLFPITKPIDVNQFTVPEEEKTVVIETVSENVDTKLFKRKKRIGIAFDCLPSKPDKRLKGNDELPLDEERVGFGFKPESDTNSNENKYNNLKKGIPFIKTVVLEPSPVDTPNNDDFEVKKQDLRNKKDIVAEKVSFLCEGKCDVSAVQIMMIQLQTLEEAFKAGGLNEKYFYSWLRETDTELAKLEKEAAPEGWICQWDRSNKRYFYRNEVSGETQWNYPQQDIVGGQEAMDICTTPPPENPPEVETPVKEPEPPPPPIIGDRSPSPPPPPMITNQENKSDQPPLPPLPIIIEATPPPPPPPLITTNQPLPPGVDQIEPYVPIKVEMNRQTVNNVKINKEKPRDSFGSELDSFYSDIAIIEASTSTVTEPTVQETLQTIEPETTEVVVKKKKKVKSKLTQGSTMKKKAVSSLVEKWKKVQNDYM